MEREVGGGIGMGNTCKPMADSFQCMTKSITIKKKMPLCLWLLASRHSEEGCPLSLELLAHRAKIFQGGDLQSARGIQEGEQRGLIFNSETQT